MSLSIIEIKSIPQYQLLDNNIEAVKQSVYTAFCELLSYFSSVTVPEQSAIELIFHKFDSDRLRLFLTLRSGEQAHTVPVDKIVSGISTYLKNMHFNVHRLTGEEFLQIVNELRSQLNGRIAALVKSEKLITSNLSYSGYYYYTDILEPDESKKAESNNYNALIAQLMACERAMVAFQLIPTQFTQDEYYALSNLAGELEMAMQGFRAQDHLVRENAAEKPEKTYTYYNAQASHPLFVGNIIIVSDTDALDGIVSMLRSGIQQSTLDTVDLTSVELGKDPELSYDFFRFPWKVYERLLVGHRNQNIWNGTVFQPINLLRLPFFYTAAEAAGFFKVPIDDGRIRGICSNKVSNDNEMIDSRVLSENNIKFGELLDSRDTVIGAEGADFTRHALVVGAPGSGKTTFAINLLLQFYEKGVPFLVIEPTKTEYRALIDKIPGLQIFTPGNSGVVPFIINPFIPPKGIRLEQYIPSLMSAFRAAFSMESPLDIIFLKAVRQCYAQHDWKNSSTCEDTDIQFFGLFEFVLTFKEIVANSSYKPETKANIETGGTFRLLNLLDQNKYIYDNINTIPIDVLCENPTIIELNAIADEEQKALVMALLLIHICLYTKSKGSGTGGLDHILMIDEAHVLLSSRQDAHADQNKAQGATVKSLQNMIAEIRSFGTGIIIADQAPSKVTSDIVANTDIKLSFRLVEQNERAIMANSTNMTEQQSQYLARLKKGEAFLYYSGLESPKVIVTADIRREKGIRFHVPDEEIKDRVRFWATRGKLLMPYYECAFCPQCNFVGGCDYSAREKAEYYAAHIISMAGADLKERETFLKYLYRLHEMIIRYESRAKDHDSILRICNCTKIHFLRSVLMENDFRLNRKSRKTLLIQTLIKEGEDDV